MFFGHGLEKTKNLKVFCFLDKLMVKIKELWRFCFFALVVFTCLLKICPKTKKDLSFLSFLPYFK